MTNPAPLDADSTALRRRLMVLVGLLLAGFWPTLITFPGTWSASYQEHGFFLGGLVVWFGWKHRDRFLANATPGLADLVPVAALLSVGWLLAAIMNVRAGHQLAFVLIGVVWAFAVFGWGARVQILTLGATLALAIPVWGVVVPVLQRMTVIASGAATRLAGIEAIIGYDTIAISTGTFLVEEGCAGINYLLGGLTLGAFYAHLFTDRWQTQLKIVGLAGIASIVGNWIRVTVLVFLGEATAMQSPYIEDHLWQGWAIFTLLMIPTYQLARRIERRDSLAARSAAGARAAEAVGEQHPGRSVAVGPEGASTPGRNGDAADSADGTPKSAEAAFPSPRLATLATAAALVGPVLYMVIGVIPRGSDLDRTPTLFAIHDAWQEPVPASSGTWSPDYQGIDARADWTVEAAGHDVELARHYFVDQRQGAELIQYNNRVAPDSLVVTDRMYGPVGPQQRIVHEAIFFSDEKPRIAWYWYRVGGFDTPFSSKAKLLEIVAFFRRAPAAELVTMSVACEPESCADAAQALRAAVGGPEVVQPAAPEPSAGSMPGSEGDGSAADSTGTASAGDTAATTR